MARVQLIDVSKRFGATTAVDRLQLDIADGEFLTLLGGSGCGKTTTLNMIAGLEAPSSGSILFDDEDVTLLSPRDRNVAVVFQSYALYPHMTVANNLAFPLRMARIPRSEIAFHVQDIARLLQIESLLARKPRALSGGQQQRVALGRALIRRPRVFLLDEPLSNLDARLRVAVRQELKGLHQTVGTTMIYVTHDQEEAMALSDRIAVIHGGSVLQCAPPQQIYTSPADLIVAQLVGSPPINIIDAERNERGLMLRGGTEVSVPHQYTSRFVTMPNFLWLAIRPEHVLLNTEDVHLQATVGQVDHFGKDTHVQLDCNAFKITATTGAESRLRPGDTVTWQWNWDHLLCFDPNDGHNLHLSPERSAF